LHDLQNEKSLLAQEHAAKARCLHHDYNEYETELKFTLRGLIQNYNILYMDPDVKLQQQDMVVCCVCDGYEQIKQGFKDYAAKYGFFDLDKLKSVLYKRLHDGRSRGKMEDEDDARVDGSVRARSRYP